MEDVNLQYANASAYLVGNWLNDILIGPGLEYNDDDILLRKYIACPVQNYLINSTLEYCIKRNNIASGGWEVNSSTQVDAVSFYETSLFT